MRALSRSAGRFTPIVAAALLAGCGRSDDSTLRIVVMGEADDTFEAGARLPLAAQLLRAATAEGLVAFDEQGRIVPALADRWIVTDDGRSYIFRLRDGHWKDGSPLSGKAAQAALRDAITALEGSSLALDLAGIEDIRVMAGRVIEIRLDRPMPHLLQVLAQPEMGLLRKQAGAGPMRLQREQDTAVLTPIRPEELGQPALPRFEERARTLRLTALPGKDAVARFNAGEASLVLGGRIEDFPLASSVGMLRGTIQLDPVIGLFGLSVMNADDFLELPENREAIAMAIDREGMIAAFGVGGWTPTTRVVSAAVDGDLGTIGERWGDLDLAERRTIAKARVARWQSGREAGLRLRVALPEGPGADALFARLKQDLAQIGIEAGRVDEGGRADLRLVDDVARYPLAIWFLNRLSCGTQRGLCNRAADERAAEARLAADPAARAALLAEAEAELTAANVFIPFGAPIRWSLVRSDATGFAPNRWAWHPLMPMAVRPK